MIWIIFGRRISAKIDYRIVRYVKNGFCESENCTYACKLISVHTSHAYCPLQAKFVIRDLMVVKVKVQALRLCTGRTAPRGIALPFHDCGTRRG